jgi:membrane associated rhomboid family serine protease
MGLYDRDYYRSEEPGYHISVASWTLTTKLILLNVAVYLVQLVTDRQGSNWFGDTFALSADWWTRPWLAYQLLTYGFLHAPDNVLHIVFNMFLLWLLGRELEAHYGRKEFLAFYLMAIVVAGIAWSAVQYFLAGGRAACWGASGGVTASLVLFAFNFPRREVALYFVLPIPVWVFATFVVAMDIYGTLRPGGERNVGYEAHLGGAAFGLAYYQLRWRLSGWIPGGLRLPSFKRRPKLRVHRPEPLAEDALELEVDEILQKIQEHGMASLTRRERQTLEKAGQEYKRRRQ